MTIYRILGSMTGTSADGIDLGLITTDGEKIIEFGANGFYPYSRAVREKITSWFGRGDIDPVFSEPADTITDLHLDAINGFFAKHGLSAKDIDAIGFHGQTIYHAPQKKITCQLGNGDKLAAALHVPIVWQFRQRDMIMGGQGAPLMPPMHRAVADFFHLARPLVFLNIGGVANITFIGDNSVDNLWAADVGPGNALIDDYVKRHAKKERDDNGLMALQGRADKKMVARWMQDRFFDMPIPKSLDRNYFSPMVWRDMPNTPPNDNLNDNLNDDLATLSFFTAQAIVHAINHLPTPPSIILAAGGGRHNQSIMKHLQAGLPTTIELKDLDAATDKTIADNLEAFGFGFLAARVLRGLPLTLPTTTGVITPTGGGVVSRPS